jgi:hypothetical protein
MGNKGGGKKHARAAEKNISISMVSISETFFPKRTQSP